MISLFCFIFLWALRTIIQKVSNVRYCGCAEGDGWSWVEVTSLGTSRHILATWSQQSWTRGWSAVVTVRRGYSSLRNNSLICFPIAGYVDTFFDHCAVFSLFRCSINTPLTRGMYSKEQELVSILKCIICFIPSDHRYSHWSLKSKYLKWILKGPQVTKTS